MISDLLNVNLITELGLDTLPKERQEELVTRMTEVVADRLNVRVTSVLSESELKELETVVDEDKDISEFLRSKIPNFDIMVAEIVADFKKEMLELGAVALQAFAAAQTQSTVANKA